MSTGRAGDSRFSSGQAMAAAERTEITADARADVRPPPVQLRVAPASHGARLARMSSRRETATAAAAQRGRPSTSDAGHVETQNRQWVRAPGKNQPTRRPQRVRTLKLKTQVHPDALVPFLYGERGSPINAIMHETGCSIDYCALSPDDMEDEAGAAQGRPHTMTFLVSAETTEMLEDGSRRLRLLVGRVQTHVQRRMKAQNIYERQERQAANAAEEQARAGMLVEEHAARMDALELDGEMTAFPTLPQQARSREAQSVDPRRRAALTDSDRPRLVQEAYPFPTRPRAGPVGRLASPGSSEHYREMMWTRPQPDIYFRMDEPAGFPLQHPRYPDVVDLGQHETKNPLPPPESSGRPINSAGESLLGGGDGSVRPYVRRRLHASLDRPRRGVAPHTHPPSASAYTELDRERVGVRRAMKRPLRTRPPSTLDHDAFTAMQSYHGCNRGEQQGLEGAADLSESAASAAADASAAMPVRLDRFDVDEDADGEWVTRPVPRRYRRPVLGYYVRTPDGYVEPVAPPSGAYYYGHPQAMYDDFFDYGDSVEWISDDDDGAYGYEYPRRLEQFPAHGVPDGGHMQRRQFVRSSPLDDDYRIRSMLERAPPRPFKRRKVVYGDLREQGYQAESDSAPDERSAVVFAPHSDEEARPPRESLLESNSMPPVAVRSVGREASRGDAEPTPGVATPISEGEENGARVSTNEPAIAEQPRPAPDATTTEDPPIVQGAGVQDVPVDADPSSVGTATAIVTKDQSDETGEALGLEHTSDRVDGADAAPALPLAADEVVAVSRQSESDPVVLASSSLSVATAIEAPQDDMMAGHRISCSATDDLAIAESCQADAPRDVETTAAREDSPASSADGTSATGDDTTPSNAVVVATEHRVVASASPRQVSMPITASMTMNDRLAHSLENMNRCEADLIRIKEELSSQKKRYLVLQKEERHRKRLQMLLDELVRLQCRLSAHDSLIFGSLKYEVLKAIQALLDSAADSDASTAVKVELLRKGLETFVDVQAKVMDELPTSSPTTTKTQSPAREELADDPVCVGTDHHGAEEDRDVHMDDAASPSSPTAPPSSPAAPPAPEEPHNDTVDEEEAQLSVEPAAVAQVVKLERNFDDFGVKQENVSMDCPAELPSFLWQFLTHSLTPDASQSSYVMKVMHNRLLEEIMKSNPYYYLHRSMLHPRRTQTSTSNMCEFGCRGASATKWERKLTSQINSRMKSFDNAAYSLARSGGGKDVLNRKKLNSIIRKVHLVAMQVHSLLSHLYCLKDRVVCSEVDAMSSALHNSHFERRMGVYKSRLKLVFPHKQPSISGATLSKEPEDLVRDTFEFFPELLVCVDIWGYNYREALIKRQRERETIILTADGVPTEPTRRSEKPQDPSSMLPQAFTRAVDGKAFDFDNDANGLLRCLCDELLNIVCLWNDFKWMENLEALDLERIIAFEKSVGSSIIKILTLYADHLQALWAARIETEPEYLYSVRLTQHNAYYTPHSLVPFLSRGVQVSADCAGFEYPLSADEATPLTPEVDDVATLHEAEVDPELVKQLESDADNPGEGDAAITEATAQTSEERVAEAYWSRKTRPVETAESNPPIDADELVKTDEAVLSTHLLDTDVECKLHADLEELSTVARELLVSNGDECRPIDVAGQCCIVSGDIVQASEKLALHSAASQIQDEADHQLSTAVNPQDVSEVASPRVQAPSRSSRRPRRREMVDAWSLSPPSLSDQSAADVDEDAVYAGAMLLVDEDEDQPVRDVIEVLAATKRQLHELTAQRARSARVREKLQLHAVDLARQALELVRNTAQMYT